MGMVFTGSNVLTWSIALGTPMVLLGEHLGASTAQIGALYSFAFLLAPLQILATTLIPRFGYKKLALFSWGTRTLFLIIPVWAALQGGAADSSLQLNAFIFSLFALCLIRTLGIATAFPWVMEWVPDNLRARYYACENLTLSSIAVISLILSALLLNFLPTGQAYALLYGMSFVGGIAATYAISRIPDVTPKCPPSPSANLLKDSLRICTDRTPLRGYLCFHLFFGLCNVAYVPFTTYYLRAETDMSDSAILSLSVIGFISMAITSYILQKIMARLGMRNGFYIWAGIMLIQALYWLAILLGADVLLKLLPLSHVLNGIAAACFMCVHMKYLAQLSDTGNRALILSVFGAIVGLFGGLTPILWGWILKGSGADGGAMNLGAFTCFFVLMALTFALLPISIRRFQLSEDQQPIVFNPSALLRPDRIFTALGQLYVDSKKK